MAARTKTDNPGKGTNKRSVKPPKAGSTTRSKKGSSIKSTASQHKPKPTTATTLKRKAPHLRYTEKELKVPQLNGIRPAGIQKPPNKKKGKHFVDDGDGMRTILAMVMAEKEGNIESKMMRARQMEELREARRVEAEKRVEGKKAGLEERKEEIKQSKKKRRYVGSEVPASRRQGEMVEDEPKKPKKRVSFG